MISKVNYLLTKKDKKFLLALLFFSIFISVIETAGISVIMPFMEVATNFDVIHSKEYYMFVYNFFGLESDVGFVVLFGALLIFFYIFRSGVNLLYFYMLSRFAQSRYHFFTYRLLDNYMGMEYKDFTSRNSSTMTKSIINEASNLTQLFSALLLMVSEIFIVVFIYGVMLYINYQITLVLTVVLVLNALLMVKTVSVKIKKVGIMREKIQQQFYEIINRSFGNFQLIKLRSMKKSVLQEFGDTGADFAKANIINATLNNVPKLFLEAVGFSIVIFIVTYLVWVNNSDVSSQLSVISMFVLALYRLMPSINRIMLSYNNILFNYKALEIVHEELTYNGEDLGDKEVLFNNDITIENLCFEYEENKQVLKNINLNIKKGSKVAFVGESGSGKSTLVDLIIGLYRPKDGKILIDNVELNKTNIKDWRSKIGYISQSIYLFDGTVGENVAFFVDYDRKKVDECLKKAKIYDFLNTKEGQDTFVGEGGIKLSGGQKQRIAIARALYSNPDILVLDEATSSLDEGIEEKIMDEIYDISFNKTLIIIAHRLSTLTRCERIYKIQNGQIIKETIQG